MSSAFGSRGVNSRRNQNAYEKGLEPVSIELQRQLHGAVRTAGATDSAAPSLKRRAQSLARLDTFKLTREGMLQVEEHLCLFCPYPEESIAHLTGARKLRRVIHCTLEDPNYSIFGKAASVFILGLIVFSTFAFCLESVPELEVYTDLWKTLEAVVSIPFTLEYLLRLITSGNKLKFIAKPLNVIDFLAFAPFYLFLFFDTNASTFRVFRSVRLVRLFRLFKVSRYSSNLSLLFRVMMQSKDAFGLLIFFLVLGTILFSSVMYYAEKDVARPNGDPSPFYSIPATFYWCVVTMTTVGYGDDVPVTAVGKLIAGLTTIMGVLVLALPITILGSNFQECWDEQKDKKKIMALSANRPHLDVTSQKLLELCQDLTDVTEVMEEKIQMIHVLVQQQAPPEGGMPLLDIVSMLERSIKSNLEGLTRLIFEATVSEDRKPVDIPIGTVATGHQLQRRPTVGAATESPKAQLKPNEVKRSPTP